jgi:hypothetical protein
VFGVRRLLNHQQELLYIPGRTVHHASGGYRGDGKTDAKDAAIIADKARMRKDLHPLRHRDKTAVDLRILCARRTDLAVDWNRAINRLRAQLLEYLQCRHMDEAQLLADLTDLRCPVSELAAPTLPGVYAIFRRRRGTLPTGTRAPTAGCMSGRRPTSLSASSIPTSKPARADSPRCEGLWVPC